MFSDSSSLASLRDHESAETAQTLQFALPLPRIPWLRRALQWSVTLFVLAILLIASAVYCQIASAGGIPTFFTLLKALLVTGGVTVCVHKYMEQFVKRFRQTVEVTGETLQVGFHAPLLRWTRRYHGIANLRVQAAPLVSGSSMATFDHDTGSASFGQFLLSDLEAGQIVAQIESRFPQHLPVRTDAAAERRAREEARLARRLKRQPSQG